MRFISKHKADELSRSSIRVGDILMVKIGSIGYSAIVDNLKNYKYAIIPANLLKISLDDKKASTKYIHQYLISPQGKKRILNIASATAQPALSLSAIKKFKIPIPPIIEQKKIASILSSVDDVIEKIQLQINKHQDLKKGTMNELLTRGIGHIEFKDSELGKIPKGWEISDLKSLVVSHNS
ncbi:MAG: restriction endonuclease subunit S, partial [SAR202 cluster bacterium]|nr:restriction endonuclease subunit S [SAR202 cluster bacterium]